MRNRHFRERVIMLTANSSKAAKVINGLNTVKNKTLFHGVLFCIVFGLHYLWIRKAAPQQ